MQTDIISKTIVDDVNKKEFEGKNNIYGKEVKIQKSKPEVTKENKKYSTKVDSPMKKVDSPVKPVVSNTTDEEWASF